MAMNTHEVPSNKVQTILSGATGTGAGSAYPMHAMKVVLQVVGISTATVEIQVSLDGTNYETVATATADDIFYLEGPYKAIRANVTAYTSGTISVYMGY